MPQLSYSTAGFGSLDLGPALDHIAAAGFRCVELACDRHVAGDHPSQMATRVRRQLEEREMMATTVHGPARRNVLGAVTEEWRSASIPVLADALRMTGEIGARGMVIHGIPNPMFLPEDRDPRSLYETMVDAMRRSVEDLVPVAAEAGVRMLLENLPYNRDLRAEGKEGDYPLMRMSDLREFVDPFPSEQVALIVDVGHAWTDGSDPASEIRIAGDRLWGTHLQDVDHDDPQDDHWAPLQGGLDWPSIFEALAEVDYPGAYTFEVIRPRNDESAEELALMTAATASTWGLFP